MITREDAERRYAQIEGERDYYKRLADKRGEERDAMADKVAELQGALTRQANAAKRCMHAAKEVGSHMEAEAKRLYAECNPDALDSERAANAHLTEDLQRAEAERDALAAHVERLRDALNYGAAYLDAGQLNSIGHGSKAHMEMVDALSETPTTSLARMRDERAQAIQQAVARARRKWAREDKAAIERRDLLKQAEELSRMIAVIPLREELARDMLKHRRDQLRRQVEESTK